MIRIVGYVVADASMTQTLGSRWFTIWEAPPQLSAARALKQAGARMATWENRLRLSSYNGVTRVALQAQGPAPELTHGRDGVINALDIVAGWGTEKAAAGSRCARCGHPAHFEPCAVFDHHNERCNCPVVS